MKYTHVLFDIDNTLIDTTESILCSLQRTLEEVIGRRWELEELTPVLEVPGMEAFEVIGIESPKQILQIYPLWEKYMHDYRYNCGLYEGIHPLLEEIDAQGLTMGIVTSKTQEQYDSEFRYLGISQLFDMAITADDTIYHKPKPDPINTYLWLNGLKPEEVLFVGDTSYDMDCAKAAGVDSALAMWGCLRPESISSDYRFHTPEEMVGWFQEGCPESA